MKECLVPFDQFIRRSETNMKLVQLYLAALASKSITYSRNEALFCFALYQVNKFMFDLRNVLEPKILVEIEKYKDSKTLTV